MEAITPEVASVNRSPLQPFPKLAVERAGNYRGPALRAAGGPILARRVVAPKRGDAATGSSRFISSSFVRGQHPDDEMIPATDRAGAAELKGGPSLRTSAGQFARPDSKGCRGSTPPCSKNGDFWKVELQEERTHGAYVRSQRPDSKSRMTWRTISGEAARPKAERIRGELGCHW